MAQLAPETIVDLERSGLTKETIHSSGIQDGASDEEIKALLRDKHKVTGYVLPYIDVKGDDLKFYRVKVLSSLNGHMPPRYLQPKASSSHLYIPANLKTLAPNWHTDTSITIFITEGEKKALAAVQHGIPCVAVGGVFNWRTHIYTFDREGVRIVDKASSKVVTLDDKQQKAYRAQVAPELDAIDWTGREVVLIFDSDAETNTEVQRAAFELANWVADHGGRAVQISLADRVPTAALKRAGLKAGAKVGLDDALSLHPAFGEDLKDTEWRAVQGFRPLPSDPMHWVTEQLNGKATRETQERVSSFAIDWLDANGTRFMGVDGTYYFFDSTTRILHDFVLEHGGVTGIRETSFGHLLMEQLGLDPVDSGTMGRLIGRFPLGAPEIRPYRVVGQSPSFPDTIYYQVSDADVMKISSAGLELISNGDDDVLFYKGSVDALDLDHLAVACDEWKLRKQPLWFDALSTLNIDPMGELTKDQTLKLLTCLFYISPWLNRWRGLMLPLEIAVAEPNSGKALADSEQVLTPSGWTSIGSLEVGNEVVGSNGRPTKVLAVYPQGERAIYRVEFTDGATVDCDLDHRWKVRRAGQQSPFKDFTLREILDRGLRDNQGALQHHLPLVDPIEGPISDLLVDPYLLGALLGDGCFTLTSIGFTCHEPAFAAEVSKSLPEGMSIEHLPNGRIVRKGARGKSNPLKEGLRSLGLLGIYGHDKFVPPQYRFASKEQRLALLQGLMDSDGTVYGQNGQAAFHNTSELLVDGLVEIVRSLGGIARKSRIETPNMKQGYLFKVSVTLAHGLEPFRAPRKLEAWLNHPSKKQLPTRAIKAVVPLGKAAASCILVDREDHLFVTNNYVLTLNSFTYNLRKGILTGRPSLSGLPNDFKDWTAILGSSPAMWICDNLGNVRQDYWHRLNDELARLITDPAPSIELRQLYTTATTFRVPIHSSFAITTIRNPFTAPDVLQRSLVYSLSAIPVGKRDPDWYTDRLAKRHEWIAEHLNVLHLFMQRAGKEWQPNYKAGYRLVHFEQAILIVGRVLGWDMTATVAGLAGVVAQTVAQYDPIMEALGVFVEEWPLRRKRIILQDIINWVEMDNKDRFTALRQFANEIQLAKYINSHTYDIEQSLGVAIEKEGTKLVIILEGG